MQSYPVMSKILPTSGSYGFEMKDYWVWCGSAVQGEDGRYHMFSARWPKKYPFFRGYVFASEIVRASSDTPYGPYHFEEVVLGDRGSSFWDGRMTHNPSIVKVGNEYALFYIGSTYEGPRPSAEAMQQTDLPLEHAAYANIRIGMATAPSVFGPWKRCNKPIFEIDPQGWDHTVVTNPSPCVLSDGSILMYYRSNTDDGMRIGVARAASLHEPFQRVLDHPLFVDTIPGFTVEDTFFWENGDHIEMIAKDMTGDFCGVQWGGVHLCSPDGLHFEFAPDRQAYSRTVRFDDGTSIEAYHLERPNIAFSNGKPAFICAAYAEKSETVQDPAHPTFSQMAMSKTIILPLEQE